MEKKIILNEDDLIQINQTSLNNKVKDIQYNDKKNQPNYNLSLGNLKGINNYDNFLIKNVDDKNNKSNLLSKDKRKRNYGIDLARIFSMCFLVNHHIIYHCGPLLSTKLLSSENNLYLYFNTIFCSGVNIFGMISGYVGYHSHKYYKLIYLVFQTSFYNFGFALYFKKTKPNIIKSLIKFIFPVFISGYWYFNQYFILYFFLPLINEGIYLFCFLSFIK